MIHITLGLLIAFISLAYFRDKLSRNDEFTQASLAAIIGALVALSSYFINMAYNEHLKRVEKERISFIQEIRKEEEEKYYRQCNSGLPLRLNGSSYKCWRYKQ